MTEPHIKACSEADPPGLSLLLTFYGRLVDWLSKQARKLNEHGSLCNPIMAPLYARWRQCEQINDWQEEMRRNVKEASSEEKERRSKKAC